MADEFEEMKPNQAAWKEKAEGSRENVNLDTDANHPNLGTGAESPMERGSGQVSQPDKPLDQGPGGRPERENAGGITNRPLFEEQHEEAQLPPRGDTKHGGHAS